MKNILNKENNLSCDLKTCKSDILININFISFLKVLIQHMWFTMLYGRKVTSGLEIQINIGKYK